MVAQYELSRRLLLADPSSSGFFRLDAEQPAYLPLYGLKKFSTTIATHINGLPTTSPHGSNSDTMQKIREFCWIRTRHVTQQRHTAKALQPPTAAPGTWMSGQARLKASGTGGRCSPLPSLAYGTPYPQSERLLGSADLRIGDDDLEYFVGPRGRDHRPVLVFPEVGERDSARRFQRVLVLRVNGRGDEDSEHCHGSRTMVKPVMRSPAVRVSIFCSCCSCATDFVTSSDMEYSPPQESFLSPINVRLERSGLNQR
jgi:hypothetical protein